MKNNELEWLHRPRQLIAYFNWVEVVKASLDLFHLVRVKPYVDDICKFLNYLEVTVN